MSTPVLSKQQIGAYGEKAVEAELLRHGWITANVNTSIKNAADFDIFAHKGRLAINVQVKTCGIEEDGFHFKGPSGTLRVGDSDFTVLVAMGITRREDQFYVVPTRKVREDISLYRTEYLSVDRRDGGARADLNWWTLRLRERATNQAGSGFEQKWEVTQRQLEHSRRPKCRDGKNTHSITTMVSK
jgi:hypothetical protein